jgi:hypothetical protein
LKRANGNGYGEWVFVVLNIVSAVSSSVREFHPFYTMLFDPVFILSSFFTDCYYLNALSSSLNMEATGSSETFVSIYRNTGAYSSEEIIIVCCVAQN